MNTTINNKLNTGIFELSWFSFLFIQKLCRHIRITHAFDTHAHDQDHFHVSARGAQFGKPLPHREKWLFLYAKFHCGAQNGREEEAREEEEEGEIKKSHLFLDRSAFNVHLGIRNRWSHTFKDVFVVFSVFSHFPWHLLSSTRHRFICKTTYWHTSRTKSGPSTVYIVYL